MIMSGLRNTPMRQSGLIFHKIIAVILCLFTLSGCSNEWWVGYGRGDWTIDLCKGYAITKVNSKSINLIYKEDIADSGGSFVIPSNYFVQAYQLLEPYIFLEGIHTAKSFATDDELKNCVQIYYVVDTETHEIIGPLENYEDLKAKCSMLNLDLDDNWTHTKDIVTKTPGKGEGTRDKGTVRGQGRGDGSVVSVPRYSVLTETPLFPFANRLFS